MVIDYIVSIGDCCVPAEFIRHRHLKKDSFPFDWAQSNIGVVIDFIENGIDWHVENNIYNQKVYDKYLFKKLDYVHHNSDFDYMIRCAKRLQYVLELQKNIIFLYMTSDEIPINDLRKFEYLISNKYSNLNFNIFAAKSTGVNSGNIRKENVSNYLTVFYCDSPKIFLGNRMNDDIFYDNLFKEMFFGCEFNVDKIDNLEEKDIGQ